jgi:PAS domain S-box-containing protein
MLVNDRLCEILGHTRSAVLARTFQEITFPDDLAKCLEQTERLAAGDVPHYSLEKRFVRPDGSVVWTRVTVSVVRLQDAVPAFFIGTVEDISEQMAAREARDVAEARLRAALDASRVGAFHFDIRANALLWADGLDRLFAGVENRELVDFFAMIHPEDRPQVTASYSRSATEGTDFEEEFRVVWPDGSTHWLHDRGCTYRDAEGQPAYIVGAITDITTHRRMDEAVRLREAEFQALANAIPQLAWMAGRDGARTWFNERWYDYTGQNWNDARDFGWLSVLHPDSAEAVIESQRAAFRAGSSWERTVQLRRSDGEYRWFLSRAAPIHGKEGTILHWIGTNTDVTDQLNLEDTLKEQSARLRSALDIETVGVIFFDNDHRITAVNRAFERMSGYDREELVDRLVLWRDFVPVAGRELARERAAAFDRTGRTTPDEEQFHRKDGSHWWGLVAATRVSPAEGVKFVLDITDRKQAEAKLHELFIREQEGRETAERESTLREQVMAVVAHDLRNPVHTITLAAGLLAETWLTEDKRARQLELIKRSASRMELLIRDLLDVSRISAGTFTVQPRPVDVRVLLGDVHEIFEPQARSRNLTLQTEADPLLTSVNADPERLIQLLTNLVGNALKFTQSGGVSIKARQQGSNVQIDVVDTGRGIPAASIETIFDRFWQADRSEGGAGLGLAIAQAIAEAHGGCIRVQSAPGRGSTFSVELPSGPIVHEDIREPHDILDF